MRWRELDRSKSQRAGELIGFGDVFGGGWMRWTKRGTGFWPAWRCHPLRAKKKSKCAGEVVGETCNLDGDPLDLGCL